MPIKLAVLTYFAFYFIVTDTTGMPKLKMMAFQSNILPPSSWMKDDGTKFVLLLGVNVRAEHTLTTYNFRIQVTVPHYNVRIQEEDNMNPFLSQLFLSQTFNCINTPAISSRLFFLLTPPMMMEQSSVPKRRHIK